MTNESPPRLGNDALQILDRKYHSDGGPEPVAARRAVDEAHASAPGGLNIAISRKVIRQRHKFDRPIHGIPSNIVLSRDRIPIRHESVKINRGPSRNVVAVYHTYGESVLCATIGCGAGSCARPSEHRSFDTHSHMRGE